MCLIFLQISEVLPDIQKVLLRLPNKDTYTKVHCPYSQSNYLVKFLIETVLILTSKCTIYFLKVILNTLKNNYLFFSQLYQSFLHFFCCKDIIFHFLSFSQIEILFSVFQSAKIVYLWVFF